MKYFSYLCRIFIVHIMKRLFSFLLFVAVTATSFAISVGSPNQRIKLIFDITLKDSVPYYQVFFDGKEVVAKSEMGFLLDGDKDLKHGFSLNSVDVKDFSSTWMPILGQYAEIEDKYNNCVVSLVQNSTGRTMRIVFRLYNEGLAFRYEFDKQDNLGYFRIADEVTQFAMTDDHTAWWIPGAYDSNEFFYTKSKLFDIDATKVDGSGIGTNQVFDKNAVQSPIMMKTSKKLYLNIFEAALVDYPAMHLLYNRKKKTFNAALAPTPVEGVKAFMQTPCNTPWRTIFVTDDAREILASSMILNLNEPCKIENTTWIKPVKYVGIWWQMHAPGQGTWNYADVPNIKLAETDWSKLTPNGRHAATTENTMRYIDFAAEHGFDAVLVEGWNVGWEDWAGQWKEEVFDFVTPYPDFDVKKVTAYARAKGVELIMHHETSGSTTNYERRIDEAFDFMKEYGYNSVKTGYVGRIIPRGEYHDGQWMVNHYNRVLEKAADRRIMVNAHEPVRPTGLSRTYPNLLACEAARGNEFNAWSVGNPPSHEIDLAFTRLLGGAMDYTPGIFEIKMDYYQPGNPCQIHTTLAKQLALYVTMYSPLQMAADLPENYERYMDAFQFIKDVDVDWLDTKVLEAEPGEYITIARKGKKYGQWFVGAITAAKARKAVIDFSFLQPDVKYIATVYADAKNADWQKNPKAYTITNYIVTNETKAKIQLAASGGCAISLKVATTEDLEKKYKKL